MDNRAGVMQPIKLVFDAIGKLQSLLTNVFFVLTIVVVAFRLINRFWFKLPVVWTADLAVLCLIWLGFLSANVRCAVTTSRRGLRCKTLQMTRAAAPGA